MATSVTPEDVTRIRGILETHIPYVVGRITDDRRLESVRLEGPDGLEVRAGEMVRSVMLHARSGPSFRIVALVRGSSDDAIAALTDEGDLLLCTLSHIAKRDSGLGISDVTSLTMITARDARKEEGAKFYRGASTLAVVSCEVRVNGRWEQAPPGASD